MKRIHAETCKPTHRDEEKPGVPVQDRVINVTSCRVWTPFALWWPATPLSHFAQMSPCATGGDVICSDHFSRSCADQMRGVGAGKSCEVSACVQRGRGALSWLSTGIVWARCGLTAPFQALAFIWTSTLSTGTDMPHTHRVDLEGKRERGCFSSLPSRCLWEGRASPSKFQPLRRTAMGVVTGLCFQFQEKGAITW